MGRPRTGAVRPRVHPGAGSLHRAPATGDGPGLPHARMARAVERRNLQGTGAVADQPLCAVAPGPVALAGVPATELVRPAACHSMKLKLRLTCKEATAMMLLREDHP